MLFIPPTDAELTSYNEIKYKNNIAISFSISTMDIKPINKFDNNGDNDLALINTSNFSNSNIQISDSDFDISNLSTWENYIEEFDIDDINIKLLKNNSLVIKSKIIKINHFTPQIAMY